jgi:hypothetical protein
MLLRGFAGSPPENARLARLSGWHGGSTTIAAARFQHFQILS